MGDIPTRQNYRYTKGTSIDFWLDNSGILDDEIFFLGLFIEFNVKNEIDKIAPCVKEFKLYKSKQSELFIFDYCFINNLVINQYIVIITMNTFVF